MNYVVKRLQVELATPESVFVSQNDAVTRETACMFFIAKGDCNVIIKDKVNNDAVEELLHRSLLPGDHFGVTHIAIFIIIIGSIFVVLMRAYSNGDREQLLHVGEAFEPALRRDHPQVPEDREQVQGAHLPLRRQCEAVFGEDPWLNWLPATGVLLIKAWDTIQA